MNLFVRLRSAEALLALTPSQLDKVFLACIAVRANSTDPIVAKCVYEDEIIGLYPIDVKTTYQQRTRRSRSAPRGDNSR